MAGGLTIAEEMIPRLRRELNKLAHSLLTEDDLIPKLRIDAQVTLDEIDHALLQDLERLAPYGAGNPGRYWRRSSSPAQELYCRQRWCPS